MYGTIKEVNLLLIVNALSIRSRKGNGQLGHIVLTMVPATYATITGVAFIQPSNPGVALESSANTKTVLITNLELVYKRDKE